MRILVADDHVLLTDMLAIHMRKLGPDFLFETVPTLNALLQCAAVPKIDLIILDLHMPGMHGLAGLGQTRQRFRGTPVALMSGDITMENIQGAATAGAVGFIPKTIGGKAMVDALLAMTNGARFFPLVDKSYGHAAQADYAASVPPSPVAQALASLTRRERDVLRGLCAGGSNSEIGKTLRLEPVTVGLYLRTAYRKLGVHSRGQAIKICLESGLDL